MKSFTSRAHADPQPIQPAIPSITSSARPAPAFHPQTIPILQTNSDELKSAKITSSGSYWMTFHKNDLWERKSSISEMIQKTILPLSRQEAQWTWEVLNATSDENNTEHVRAQQYFQGAPVVRQEIVLHVRQGSLDALNGYVWTGTVPVIPQGVKSTTVAIPAAKSYLGAQGVAFSDFSSPVELVHETESAKACWYPRNGNLRFAYEIEIHPNALDSWVLYMDAVTLEVLEAYSLQCAIYPAQLLHIDECQEQVSCNDLVEQTADRRLSPIVVDGPTTVMDQDLLGQNRVVNGYLVSSTFFMIDASRTGMFKPAQSSMPNDPVGVIWTIDGQNGSPQQNNFEVIHVTNGNNNWAPLEVSAHFNAGESFEYFRQKFNRNSLNGSGGNIVSIINVADENGDGLDNAFWSGAAMFYGNGDFAFKPLARGLDVAGHEMSHGVVQNTAGLEYIGQSGALNESYADVFGAMIDRNDWQIGEDVVNTNVFPSGALRDLSNPHNGGSGPNSNGWQPQHMNEYQNLPNTPEGDNGGVHVNSGIPNRAFFLFASNVGKDKAEQVYYKALRDYLVKSSQFVDMRNAVEQAAADLYGANGSEVMAARSAFDGVGIGAGQGDDHQDDIDINPGNDFILATDEQEADLYWVPPSNPGQFVKLNVPAPQSRPSFTDDGTAAVYVDQENEMILLTFDWSQGLDYQAFYLEQNPQGIWRNIVVSKDGDRIAYTTSQLKNEIWIFDFVSGASRKFTLYNPTTASGIVTGDVLYPDAMEWDYTGEFVMYDALNRIESAFGDGIEYWDISFVDVWKNSTDNFGDGYIGKLFNSLPENVSVGNPSFAKNSPYIITFDYVEEYFDIFGQPQTDYRVLAANIQAGVVNEIYQNTTIGYPSYSRLDNKILFTYDDFGDLLLATINTQPNDKTLPVASTDVVLITGAQKGIWFQTGSRNISATEDIQDSQVLVYPQPAGDAVYLLQTAGVEISEYVLIDMTGRRMQSGQVQGNKIDLKMIPAGSYLLELSNKEHVYHQVLIKT